MLASELAGMREAINQLMPDTCNILSVTTVSDGMGGGSDTWGTASARVSCRVDIKSGVEQISGAGLVPFSRVMLSLPYDTTISTANRVEHNSITYAVKNVNSDGSWLAVVRCELEKV